MGANTTQSWTALALNEPGGSVPSWSVDRANGYTAGHVAAPYDMAVGDLDGIPTPDKTTGTLAFHDEAVVAWADADDNLQIRVIDYNANASHLLVTAPTQSALQGKKVGNPAGTGLLGDVLVGFGDFNGDGKNEIVTAYQDANNDFTFAFWSYVANADGSRTLKPATCNGCQGAQPFTAASNISDETGYADLAVGDFDGDGRDDIALGFATWASATDTTDHYANLGVWTLNADLSTRAVEITAMQTDEGTLPRVLNSDPMRTESGIRLVAGNFLSDPVNGFGPQRSELAIAYDLYVVGPKVYDINISGYVRSYEISPVMNIYSVATGSCNNTLTTCNIQTTATNAQEEPTPIFPSHPSQTAYENLGTHFDAAPLSFTAGGFAGTAATDPPVDGLLASTWLEYDTPPPGDFATYYVQDSIVVPWVAKDTTHTKWTINDSQDKVGDEDTMGANWILHRYTAYDRQGNSIVLGAPAILYIEQQDHETMVAAQPPTQVDWLNGNWSNPSSSSMFYLQAGSSQTSTVTSATEQQNTWSQAVSQGTDIKASWSDNDPFLPQEKGSLEVNQKFSKQWSGLSENSTNTSSTWSTTQVAQTNQDDDISYSADDTTLYRYPVIGGPGEFTAAGSCQQGCRSYYDVAVPQGSVHFDHHPGQSVDAFQPSWENMNALSYPVLDPTLPDGPVPIADLGNYSYPDTSGGSTTQDVIDAPLYDQSNTISGNSGQILLDFAKAQGSGSTLSSSRNWNASLDLTAHASISVGDWATIGTFSADLDLTASLGYDTSKSTSGSTMGTSQTTTDTSFVLNHPTVDKDVSYDVGTAYYYAADGAAKVVHGVDLTSDPQGKNWWTTNYGSTPDPALNLPGRIELLYDSANSTYDLPAWLTSPQRQKIRQFQVLQASNDSSGLGTKGDPYTVNPAAGQPVQFEVPVHNYSLAGMKAPTTATWYAVPVDDADNNVTGPAVTIGTSTVPALAAQGVANVLSPTWTAVDGAANNAMQQYRIFVRLDEAGTSADLHPLAGPACPETSLAPSLNNKTPALYDTMKAGNVADPLGCGQDNQGYGLVTIDPASSADGVGATRLATAASPARARLAGGGLIDGDPTHQKLTETSDVPTIPVHQKVTGLVFATSDLLTDNQPTVAIYDGPVSNGNLVAVQHMPGISPSGGSSVSFTWTPTTPGLHELHEVLLGTAATGQDDEQIMRVNVAQPLTPYTVQAAASASAVPVRHGYTIAGTVTPVAATGADRTVQLQRRVGDGWTVIDTQQAGKSGHFRFHLTGAKAGTYTYRVWKPATVGRYAAASPAVTVVVGGFRVTAQARPASVDVGETVTFAGTVLPAQASAAARTVDLQLKSGATWKTVTTGRTTAHGAYVLRAQPTKPGTFAYRVWKPAASGLPAASSASISVKVLQPSR